MYQIFQIYLREENGFQHFATVEQNLQMLWKRGTNFAKWSKNRVILGNFHVKGTKKNWANFQNFIYIYKKAIFQNSVKVEHNFQILGKKETNFAKIIKNRVTLGNFRTYYDKLANFCKIL